VSDELLSRHDTNTIYYILREIELLSRFVTTNSQNQHSHSPQILSNYDNILRKVGVILQNDQMRKVARFFLYHKSATHKTLRHRLGIHWRTLYRILDELEVFGVIQTITRIRERKKGPKFSVYATPDAIEEDIHRAIQLHRRLTNPKYREAERLAQMMLTDYISKRSQPEISLGEIIQIIRKTKTHYNISDLADIIVQILSEEGIKVWR